MKKVFMILGGIVVVLVVGFILVFTITSLTSKKLICESQEGDITIMYNDEEITGYTSSNISYDLDGQKEYANQVGIDTYLDEFSNWFSNNTTGTCER